MIDGIAVRAVRRSDNLLLAVVETEMADPAGIEVIRYDCLTFK